MPADKKVTPTQLRTMQRVSNIQQVAMQWLEAEKLREEIEDLLVEEHDLHGGFYTVNLDTGEITSRELPR